jgi:dCMP deaminase
MDMARAASRRSTCFRLNVGAIVVRKNNPVAIGWNGQEPGAPHCSGNSCPGVVPGNCETTHAEVNAIKKAEILLLGRTREPLDLYVNHSPCVECAAYILEHRSTSISRIFFETPYRNTNHLAMLQKEDIAVYEVTPAGYIIEYFSRQAVELP